MKLARSIWFMHGVSYGPQAGTAVESRRSKGYGVILYVKPTAWLMATLAGYMATERRYVDVEGRAAASCLIIFEVLL